VLANGLIALLDFRTPFTNATMSAPARRFFNFRVPVDTWMPFVMIMVFFSAGGYGLSFAQRWENEWKVSRAA